MTSSASSLEQSLLRPTWAEINISTFTANLRAVAGLLSPGVNLIVVLKADGYGHGAAPLAKAATAAGVPLWGFGVSSVEEGRALREAGVKEPVLILGSLYPFESFADAIEHDLIPTVASRMSALALDKVAAGMGRTVSAHLKIDTGMGRIGVSPASLPDMVDAVRSSRFVRVDGVYTHLVQGDSDDDTRRQLELFKPVVKNLRARGKPLLAHAANSAATVLFPGSHFDAVRPGLALYGIYPSKGLEPRVSLQPVLTWKTRVVFMKTVRPGTPVSYAGTFRAQRTSRLATLPVGYADGYKRILSNRAYVLIQGRRCPVVGRVTMDQTIVDVTDVPGVDVGAEAVLLGVQEKERVSAEQMAEWAETIPYEIVCSMTTRVPRIFTA